jgi:cytochrome c553
LFDCRKLTMSKFQAALWIAAVSFTWATGAHAAGEPMHPKARPCAVCHGPQGLSVLPIAPHLAGQPEDYLAQQLRAYRSGKRSHEMMTLVAKPLSDDDIADLSAYFASFRIEIKAAP